MKKVRIVWTALIVGIVAASSQAQAPQVPGVKRALLVGINLYQPAGTTANHPPGCEGGRCDLPQFSNLNGPINDVAAIRDLLASPKFGFDPKNIIVLTNPDLPPTQVGYGKLPASQTTHDGLLAAIEKYLVDEPQRDDTVVFYYAGHGSLRVNGKGDKLAMMVNGKPSHADSTLVPSDAWTGNYDIRDRELTEIFNKALDKGIKLTILLDSCHSGSFTRGVELGPQYAERSLGYDPRDIDERPTGGIYPSQRRENPALILSAAQQDQTAKERVFGDTPTTRAAHGAFTVALLKALETLPADAPASAVYRQVSATLEGELVGDQTPSLDASQDRAAQPLFGGAKTGSGKTRAAAIGVEDEDRTVLLDAGKLSGFDVGSEFTSEDADSNGVHTKVRVDNLDGLTRATAKIVTPLKSKVHVGQLFDLSKWVPNQVDTLHVWTWPANLSAAQVTAAATQVKESGITVVSDPVEQPWTDMLAWNGTEWELRHAARTQETAIGSTLSADALAPVAKFDRRLCVRESLRADEKRALGRLLNPAIVFDAPLKSCHTFLLKEDGAWKVRHVEDAASHSLGATLAGDALRQALPSDAKLWANLPPPQDLASKLALHVENSLVAGVDDPANADYILAGSLSDDGPQWAWFHKPEYMAGPREQVTNDHSPGCSAQSKYPVATDWVLAAEAASIPDAASVLNGYALRLAKVNGWMNIAGDLSGASGSDYYKLIFQRVEDQSLLPEGVAGRQGDRVKMALTSDHRVIEQRWVYVLDIDCHGKGLLLYPLDTTENRFPTDADSPRQFVLPGAPTLRIGPPYGVDTILLISTQEPLPDPYALNFEGVSKRGGEERGAPTPLEQLLSNTSGGMRGAVPEMPTNWNIDAITLKSVPNGGK